MAIVSISEAPYEGNGYAKEIAISFQKVETVSSRKTMIPDIYGATGVNAGTASTAVTHTPSAKQSENGTQTHSSIAYGLASSFGVFK